MEFSYNVEDINTRVQALPGVGSYWISALCGKPYEKYQAEPQGDQDLANFSPASMGDSKAF